MNNVLQDHFRVPAGLLGCATKGPLTERPEFFEIGGNLRLYGRHSTVDHAGGAAAYQRAVAAMRFSRGQVECRFDAGEVVSNLLHERYEPEPEPNSVGGDVARAIYYAVRPLLGVSARRHLQRRALRGWESRTFPHWPVDRTADLLRQELLRTALLSGEMEPIPFIWFWPEGKQGCVLMTHDVETTAGLEACHDLMDLDQSYGLRSSFQLIPGGRYHVSTDMLTAMRSRGFEVNLHDWNHDGALFKSRAVFEQRAGRINECASQWQAEGFRAGSLYRHPDWLDLLHVSYDMSSPNTAQLDPQHGGCCTVFPWFAGNVLEIPVTMTQDYTLFHILGDYSIDLWRRQLKIIFDGFGMASCIVHPDYILEHRARRIYQELLAELRDLSFERNLWTPIPGEVNRWWRERQAMRLERAGDRWIIVGRGSEQARVAYAKLDGDRLVYSLENGEPESTQAIAHVHESDAAMTATASSRA